MSDSPRVYLQSVIAVVLLTLGCSTVALSAPPAPDDALIRAIDERYVKFAQQFPGVSAITVEQLQKAAPGGTVRLVDVREGAERETSVIPGAITREEFERNRELYRRDNIVTYCTVGYRSGIYAQNLLDEGFQVQNLKGGILAWVASLAPIVDTNGPTRRVHVNSRRWKGLLATGYEPVW